MTFQGDPYRTLGIPPGASLNEIRSAYRRLVKQYHPDAAGERALPRFLSIQAAYEKLVDGEGRLRPQGSGNGRAPRAGGTAGGSEPWRADPTRARASRDAWRARRGTGSGAGATGAGPGAGAGAGSGAGATGSTTGSGASGSRPRGGPGGRSRGEPGARTGSRSGAQAGERPGRRPPRKATPGSTTYDDAAEIPREPAWDGGAWYGPSSGTYWTLNPREYADPRKHGPEYLARAWRAAGAAGGAGAPAGSVGGDDGLGTGPFASASRSTAPEPTPETEVGGEGSTWRWSGAGRTTTDGGAAEWGTRAWTYEGTGPSGTAWTEGARDRRRGHPGGTADAANPADLQLPDLESLARRAAPRSLLALARRPERRWRLLLAFAGWPPIGFAVGSLLNGATGCGSFSASCPEPLSVLPVVAQPLVLAALVLLPAVAAVAAFASLAALAVALPVAAVLSVGTVPESRVGAPVLGVLTAAAYLAALAGGAVAVWRRAPGDPGRADGGTGP